MQYHPAPSRDEAACPRRPKRWSCANCCCSGRPRSAIDFDAGRRRNRRRRRSPRCSSARCSVPEADPSRPAAAGTTTTATSFARSRSVRSLAHSLSRPARRRRRARAAPRRAAERALAVSEGTIPTASPKSHAPSRNVRRRARAAALAKSRSAKPSRKSRRSCMALEEGPNLPGAGRNRLRLHVLQASPPHRGQDIRVRRRRAANRARTPRRTPGAAPSASTSAFSPAAPTCRASTSRRRHRRSCSRCRPTLSELASCERKIERRRQLTWIKARSDAPRH